MANSRTLYHNSSLGSDVCCWTQVGENIGEGQSESSIENAFMNSTPHRDNILSSAYTQIGVGTATDSSGTIWVDEVFRDPTGSSGSHHVRTSHTTTYHATYSSHSYRPPTPISRPKVRHVNWRALLARRLHEAALRRGHPLDPVAAAFGFLGVMAQLQH
jgi:hypothetical protein